MNGISPGEAGGIVAGIIAVAAALGKGIAWLLNWHGERSDAKSARLAAWEESLDRREREQREQLEQRFHDLENDVHSLRSCLLEVTLELRVLDPGSAALEKASRLLSQAFPIDRDTPEEIERLARRLDGEEQ